MPGHSINKQPGALLAPGPVGSTEPLQLELLATAGLSPGCLAARCQLLTEGHHNLQCSLHCDTQLAVEYIVKGKYLRLCDVLA